MMLHEDVERVVHISDRAWHFTWCGIKRFELRHGRERPNMRKTERAPSCFFCLTAGARE